MKELEMLKEILVQKEKQIYQMSQLLDVFQSAGFVIKGFDPDAHGNIEKQIVNEVICNKEYRELLRKYYVPALMQDERLRKVMEFAFSKADVTLDDVANTLGEADLVKEFEELGKTPEIVKDYAETQFKMMMLNVRLGQVVGN